MFDQQALSIGQIFADRYRVERFLAKGGFGAVYVAEQIETELKVALKVLWPHVLHSQDAVDKFRLEARVAGRVGSEHIVKVFDAGFDGASGMPFLVMELLHGAELDKVVELEGPLAWSRVAAYFKQIAAGLDRAHGYTKDGVSTPIVHRDLKPENLFLANRETGEPLIKILDFGIAKVVSESTNVSQEVKGTPLYMAFEQVAAGKITPQTDIWPLGLIGFYLLTGKSFWKAANHAESTITQLFGEVLSLPIEPASERAAQLGVGHLLPPAFDAWFARCVDREPARRFASAGECARVLADALGASSAPASVLPLSSEPAGSGAARAAQTLGRTTGAPFVTRADAREAGARRPRLKWLLPALAVLVVTGAVVARRALRPSYLVSESARVATPPAPSQRAGALTVVPSPVVPSLATTPAVPQASAQPAASAPAPAVSSLVVAARSAAPRSSASQPVGKPPTGAPAPAPVPPAAAAVTPSVKPTAKPVDVYGDR